MSEYNGTTSIDNKFLDVGDLFGLRYNSGFIFLEVTGWNQTRYAPHTDFGTVPGQSGTGFNRIEDPDNDDILFTEKDTKKVKHVAIGHSPAVLRRYTNYPESENRLRKIPNLDTPVPGDDYGYVDGEDSPYGGPTDAEELYIPPGQHLDFNFYNPDNEEREVVLNIEMRTYNVRPLDTANADDRNAAKRILSPGSPIPVAPVGSLDNQARYELQRFWNVDTTTARTARNL